MHSVLGQFCSHYYARCNVQKFVNFESIIIRQLTIKLQIIDSCRQSVDHRSLLSQEMLFFLMVVLNHF